MRWLVFILLLLELVFCVSVLFPAPAGQAGLLWPVDRGAQASMDGILGYSTAVPGLIALLAIVALSVACAAFFAEGITERIWKTAAVAGAILSTLIWLDYYSAHLLLPIILDLVLLGGILSRRWSLDALRLRPEQNVLRDRHPLMRIPVPWIFILTFLAGIGMQTLFPLPTVSPQLTTTSRIAGIILTLVGLVLAAWGLTLFGRAHTTTVPFQQVSQLVTAGPYQWSRNPMYVGLLLLYLGEAGLFVELWPLILLPLPLLYLSRVIVPYEEAQLQEAYGEKYAEYCARVRRWL